VLAFFVVAAITCIVEYGIVPSHGMYAYYMVDGLTPESGERLVWWSSHQGEIIMRLPLFAAFLILLTAGLRLLIRNMHGESRINEKF
jgi:hypothetical protein